MESYLLQELSNCNVLLYSGRVKDTQAASAGLDPTQSPRSTNHQLQPGLEGRQSTGSTGGQLCTRYALLFQAVQEVYRNKLH